MVMAHVNRLQGEETLSKWTSIYSDLMAPEEYQAKNYLFNN